MKKLEKPSLNYSDVFDTCIDSIRKVSLRKSLIKKKNFFVDADVKYTQLSNSHSLGSFVNYEKNVLNENIEHDDIVNLYSKLRKNDGASKYYDQIYNSSKKCLYCNGNLVRALDHYLPKSRFPLLSINPSNLVPCCNDCNFKLNALSHHNSTLIIHPYFEHYDDIFEKQWLYARVPQDQPFFMEGNFTGLGISFYTDFENTGLDSSVKDRIDFQFRNLMLESYVSNCVPIISKELSRLRRNLGTPILFKRVYKKYLLEQMGDYPLNSFYQATYYALAHSDMYLKTIEEDFF